MDATRAEQLLAAWEQGCDWSPPRRAVALLAAAVPDEPPQDLARWSIGRRDRELLDLREGVFGPALTCLADCPACGSTLEMGLAVDDVRLPRGPEGGERFEVEQEGVAVAFRLPNSDDLAAASEDPPFFRRVLLERCVETAEREGIDLAPAELPPAVQDAVSRAMADADPQADIRLNLACPDCGHGWNAPFDIAAYLWTEVDAWARSALGEVHALASAYGWSEAAILALSPRRRRFYLEARGG